MDFDRNVAEQRVRGPAIGLFVTAGVGALTNMASIVLTLLGALVPYQQSRPELEGLNFLSGSISLVFALLGLASACFTVYGALKLKRLESYGIALAASIVALVPCVSPCCLIGLPIGIWALVVMHAPDVRPAFR